MTAGAALNATATITNAMTVDVEDYFHVSNFDGVVTRDSWPHRESRVEASTDRLLAAFDAAGVTATFFVLAWVAERMPRLVTRIAAAGHELASHGYAHRLVYEQSPEAFRDDVRRAKHLIEDAGGRAVRGYRAPSFSITSRSLWAFDVLADEGYTYDSSVFPIRHDRYGIPGADRQPVTLTLSSGSLVEVPAATVRLAGTNLPIGGGGYFRLLPYAWTAWGIDRVNRRERRPVVFYLHPWEVDPEQPRLPAPWLARVRHYGNLHRTEARLGRLLRRFRFGTMQQLIDTTPLGPPRSAALTAQ
jgi:polysaccharide deacetylase family protein (PEP-CTERM system associated)